MAIISTIAGTQIEAGHTYRVTYSGNQPRHNGAVWKFTTGGRGTKDANGTLVPSAHGEIVWHFNASIVQKLKTEDPYLSVKFEGTIEEVQIDNCVGVGNGAQPCTRAAGSVPEVVIRDVPVSGDPRCGYCQRNQVTWEQQQASQQRQADIDDSLAAAIARRSQPQAPVAPVPAGPIVVRRQDTVITAAGDDHPLAHLIPDIIHYDLYVSREVDGVKDLDILDRLAARGENWLTEGPTESGKTALITAWCALRRRPLVTVPCNGGIDATSIFSTKTLVDGNVATVLSNVTKALQFGGVINWDELNFAPQKVTAVLHEALDDRRQVSLADLGYDTFNVHPECFIVASYNGGTTYRGTVELNHATKRRFKQLPWGYHDATERQLITRLPSLHTLKDEVRSRIAVNDIETPLGPSKLLQFERDAVEFNLDLAISFFLGSFLETERDAVAELILHHRHQLEQELAAITAAS